MLGVVVGMVWEAAFVLGVALVLAHALKVKGGCPYWVSCGCKRE